jgi:hypothetical protein
MMRGTTCSDAVIGQTGLSTLGLATRRGVKGIADSHRKICIGLAVHHQLGSRHAQVDAHAVWRLTVMSPRPLYDHPAACQATVVGLEIDGFGADLLLRCLGERDISGGKL